MMISLYCGVSLPPYPLPLSPTYTESGTFGDSGRVEQILSKTSSPYKRPGLPPWEKVKQHLIRDKFLSKPKAQKIIDNWNMSASWPLNVYPEFQPSPRMAKFLDSEPRKKFFFKTLYYILQFSGAVDNFTRFVTRSHLITWLFDRSSSYSWILGKKKN